MGFISKFLIFSSDSSLILVKDYRKNEDKAECIIKEIMEKCADFYKPYLVINKQIHCFVIMRENVYFCATTTKVDDEIYILEIITRFVDIIQDFCGTVNENVVRNNIILIYEILEEFLVDGYVQVDSTEKMKSLIFNEANLNTTKNNSLDIFGINSDVDTEMPSHASKQPIVRQRTEQITSKRKREIYLDFLETLSVTFNKDGSTSNKKLIGKLIIKCFLPGNHSIRLAFNTDIPSSSLMNSTNDQCMDLLTLNEGVKHSKSDRRIITFHAPDREMMLMRFKMEGDSIKCIPITLTYDITNDANSYRDLNLRLEVSTSFASQNVEATKLIVTVPLPRSTTSITQHLSGTFQSAHMDEENKQLVWTLRKIPDKCQLRADIRLINAIDGDEDEARSSIGPATLEFEVAGLTASGMKINSLVVEDSSDADTTRWIRYILSSDLYTVMF